MVGTTDTTNIPLIIVIAMYIGEDDERDENQLCIEGLQDIFSLLIKAAKDWFELGLALGIQVDTLEGIESNKNSDKARLREMLTHWLRSSPSRTWSDICNGLRSDTVQQDVLADIIEKKNKGTCIHCSEIAFTTQAHVNCFRLCYTSIIINRRHSLGALVPTTPHHW